MTYSSPLGASLDEEPEFRADKPPPTPPPIAASTTTMATTSTIQNVLFLIPHTFASSFPGAWSALPSSAAAAPESACASGVPAFVSVGESADTGAAGLHTPSSPFTRPADSAPPSCPATAYLRSRSSGRGEVSATYLGSFSVRCSCARKASRLESTCGDESGTTSGRFSSAGRGGLLILQKIRTTELTGPKTTQLYVGRERSFGRSPVSTIFGSASCVLIDTGVRLFAGVESVRHGLAAFRKKKGQVENGAQSSKGMTLHGGNEEIRTLFGKGGLAASLVGNTNLAILPFSTPFGKAARDPQAIPGTGPSFPSLDSPGRRLSIAPR
ncbi:hypothetical protein VUR80DRAFT_9131 [Thermomyces stellatus]